MKKASIVTVILVAANIALLAVIINGYNERKREERLHKYWEEGVDWYVSQKSGKTDGGKNENTENNENIEITENTAQPGTIENEFEGEDFGIGVFEDAQPPELTVEWPEGAE